MTAPPAVAARAKPKTSSTPSSADKQKTTASRQQSSQNTNANANANVKLKVVVRGLPPNLPEAKFKQVTAEWVNENTVDWYYYVTGKLHERYETF